jgi:hypothetical protein
VKHPGPPVELESGVELFWHVAWHELRLSYMGELGHAIFLSGADLDTLHDMLKERARVLDEESGR